MHWARGAPATPSKKRRLSPCAADELSFVLPRFLLQKFVPATARAPQYSRRSEITSVAANNTADSATENAIGPQGMALPTRGEDLVTAAMMSTAAGSQ